MRSKLEKIRLNQTLKKIHEKNKFFNGCWYYSSGYSSLISLNSSSDDHGRACSPRLSFCTDPRPRRYPCRWALFPGNSRPQVLWSFLLVAVCCSTWISTQTKQQKSNRALTIGFDNFSLCRYYFQEILTSAFNASMFLATCLRSSAILAASSFSVCSILPIRFSLSFGAGAWNAKYLKKNRLAFDVFKVILTQVINKHTPFSSFSIAAGLANCFLYDSKSILGKFSGKLATLFKKENKHDKKINN